MTMLTTTEYYCPLLTTDVYD